MNENEVLLRAFEAHPVGIILAIAVCMIVWFLGMALLFYGWPKFGKK